MVVTAATDCGNEQARLNFRRIATTEGGLSFVPTVAPMRISKGDSSPARIHACVHAPSKRKYLALTHHHSLITYHIFVRAVSSVVERLVYTQ